MARSITDEEIGLIKTLLARGERNVDIQFYFNRPDRTVNSGRISQISNGTYGPNVPAASQVELENFLAIFQVAGISVAKDAWQVAYRFHPVGQGMLHSGELRQGGRQPFSWVYDCGSVTAAAQVESELNDLCTARNAAPGPKPSLNFVALSHFDADHISGLVYLLRLFEVKMILLPFLQLWQRFWIAASSDDLDADFLRFLVDPAGYLRGVDGGGEARIVFVPPSADEPLPAPDASLPEDPRGEFDDRPMKLRLETERLPDVVDGEIPGVTGQRLSAAEFLKVGSVLDIDGLWEFVPYNDAHQAKRCPTGFPATVEPLIKTLLDAKHPADRKKAQDALKAHYDTTFGSSAYRRNIISLFLYGGPVSAPAEAYFKTGETQLGNMAFHHKPDRSRLSATHFSMLFTGDGSLNSKPRRTGFENFFTPHGRLDKTSVFQVMHHGASGNSSPEVAALVVPRASIFCSDPSKGQKHPDADVLRQFWPYNCIQVDDAIGWLMLGVFVF